MFTENNNEKKEEQIELYNCHLLNIDALDMNKVARYIYISIESNEIVTIRNDKKHEHFREREKEKNNHAHFIFEYKRLLFALILRYYCYKYMKIDIDLKYRY